MGDQTNLLILHPELTVEPIPGFHRSKAGYSEFMTWRHSEYKHSEEKLALQRKEGKIGLTCPFQIWPFRATSARFRERRHESYSNRLSPL